MKEGNKVYNYFMGNRSNLLTKREEEPTIIRVNSEANMQINHWLDYYMTDFDELMKAIVTVLKTEVTEIIMNDENELHMKLANNHEEMKLELLYADEPKCRLITPRKEMTIVIGKSYVIERFSEIIDNVRIGAEILENAIHMGKESVFITVELEEYDEKIYEAMKSNISQLSEWENIARVMIWLKDLPIELASYELAITYIDETGFYITKLSIIHHRIFRYIKANKSGEYLIDYDGTWEAEHDIFKFNYNAYEKKCSVSVPQNVIISGNRYIACFVYVREYVKMMFQNMQLINNTLDAMEKAQK